MSKFKKGDTVLFVDSDKLTPVTIVAIENHPQASKKYPVITADGSGYLFYAFTPEGRLNITDALPRLFPIPDGMVFQDEAPPAPETSFILSEVINDLKRREQVGIKKYGTTVDRSDLSTEQWVQHFYEELLDASVYARAILKNVRE